MHRMDLNENITAIVADQALDFYLGYQNSAEAYAKIDRMVLTWNYEPRWRNETRELFDALVESMIDFDVDTWADHSDDTRSIAEHPTPACLSYGHHYNPTNERCNRCTVGR